MRDNELCKILKSLLEGKISLCFKKPRLRDLRHSFKLIWWKLENKGEVNEPKTF